MKNWTIKHTLFAGLALILMANAVALLGVYWNRSGEPESLLKLTQRELQQPYGWSMNRENSGISLRIQWRIASTEKYWPSSNYGGQPEWLDQAKMASLGFDVSTAAGKNDEYRWSNRQLSREALLVLEQDGPAWQRALQYAQQHAAEQDAKLAASPNDKQMKENAKRANEYLKNEEQNNSRLFAIDAGLELATLRARYPDRKRYAIVRAQVRPSFIGGQNKIAGYIDKISLDQINVPYEYHTVFETRIHQAISRSAAQQPFEVVVAFGQRLEPWIMKISAGEKQVPAS